MSASAGAWEPKTTLIHERCVRSIVTPPDRCHRPAALATETSGRSGTETDGARRRTDRPTTYDNQHTQHNR